MTHGREKSDSAIVAGKPTNKVEQSTAEPAEPRAEAEGNASQQSTCRAQDRENVSQALERIRQAARQRKKKKFTALFHHLTIDLLEDAFDELKEDAAAGVDGLTWKEYDANLERNLEELHARLHWGAYRARPSRRVYIPKPDGRQRPLAVAALEDKIVQRATVAVLNAIYEEDFLGFSYGFRPGRGTHDALDALWVGIGSILPTSFNRLTNAKSLGNLWRRPLLSHAAGQNFLRGTYERDWPPLVTLPALHNPLKAVAS